jgi:hypothetical protein
LEDFIGKIVGQESRDHYVIERILVSPEAVVADHRVSLNKELLKWVIDFAFQHPRLDHRENWGRNFLQDTLNEGFCRRTSVFNVGIYC